MRSRYALILATAAFPACSATEPPAPILVVSAEVQAPVDPGATMASRQVVLSVRNQGASPAFLLGCAGEMMFRIERLEDTKWIPTSGSVSFCLGVLDMEPLRLEPRHLTARLIEATAGDTYRFRVWFAADPGGAADQSAVSNAVLVD